MFILQPPGFMSEICSCFRAVYLQVPLPKMYSPLSPRLLTSASVLSSFRSQFKRYSRENFDVLPCSYHITPIALLIAQTSISPLHVLASLIIAYYFIVDFYYEIMSSMRAGSFIYIFVLSLLALCPTR